MNITVAALNCLVAGAVEFTTPPQLASLSTIQVFSTKQDITGAIWMNTGMGVYRYNGHQLDYINTIGEHKLYVGDGSCLYSISSVFAYRYDIHTGKYSTVRFSDSQPKMTVALAEADSLIIGAGNLLFSVSGNRVRELAALRVNDEITALLRAPDGAILVGTTSSGLFRITGADCKAAYDPKSRIAELFLDRNSDLWIGTADRGVICLNPRTCHPLRHIVSFEGRPLNEVRTFADGNDDELYFGSVDGLFLLDSEGKLSREKITDIEETPICDLFTDKDGNLWVSSYYAGVFYANLKDFPFSRLDTPSCMHFVKGMAEDDQGTVWIATDNFGLYAYNPRTRDCRMIPGSSHIKFQGAFFDSRTNSVWTGIFKEGICRYDLGSRRFSFYHLSNNLDSGRLETVKKIVRYGDDLILGGNLAAYLFNPQKENEVCRKAGNSDGIVFDLSPSPDGSLWIAGRGLYRYSSSAQVERIPVQGIDLEDEFCQGLKFDSRGDAWIVTHTQGLVKIGKDGVATFNSDNVDVTGDRFSFAVPFGDRHVLLGQSDGLAILDTETLICRSYSNGSGITSKSIRHRTVLELSDGTILIGGDNGIEALKGDHIAQTPALRKITVDHVNGLPCPEGGAPIRLKHNDNDLVIDLTTFNYSFINSSSYYYKLEGYDNDWQALMLSEPIPFPNLAPGKYTLKTMVKTGKDRVVNDNLLQVTIIPAWYMTLAFKLLVAILVAGSIFILTLQRYRQRLLAAKLKIKEKENIERTKYFVDISYSLRTPLNLIIGQFETFFKNFGQRTQGIENLEGIYKDAKSMRKLITDYVDTQSDEIEKQTVTSSVSDAVTNAKFLNAAIGAVERNLFSPDLNVKRLCSELNIGKTKLSQTMLSATGLTPREFIEDAKLRHAAKMILDGNYRISEIASTLGFGSAKYFTIRFRKKFGCSPSEYKNNHLSLHQP